MKQGIYQGIMKYQMYGSFSLHTQLRSKVPHSTTLANTDKRIPREEHNTAYSRKKFLRS